MATIPPTRPKAVSALLAWVIFFAGPFFTAAHDRVAGHDLPEKAERVSELIIKAAEDLRDRHYPNADALDTGGS